MKPSSFIHCGFCDGVSLQPFPVAENKTGPITIDYLTKRLLALGATQTGGFLVDCETFHSMPPLGKLFHVSLLNIFS